MDDIHATMEPGPFGNVTMSIKCDTDMLYDAVPCGSKQLLGLDVDGGVWMLSLVERQDWRRGKTEIEWYECTSEKVASIPSVPKMEEFKRHQWVFDCNRETAFLYSARWGGLATLALDSMEWSTYPGCSLSIGDKGEVTGVRCAVIGEAVVIIGVLSSPASSAHLIVLWHLDTSGEDYVLRRVPWTTPSGIRVRYHSAVGDTLYCLDFQRHMWSFSMAEGWCELEREGLPDYFTGQLSTYIQLGRFVAVGAIYMSWRDYDAGRASYVAFDTISRMWRLWVVASSYEPDFQKTLPDGSVFAQTQSYPFSTHHYIAHIRSECEYPHFSLEWARDPSLTETQRMETPSLSTIDSIMESMVDNESDTEEQGSDSDSSSFVV
ncbi:hypothetical protein KIPB_008988 [Kipferlia bialata]|uniref:Uncharacterized protein n=1 Tax=Kipferlia bialata TaxID=797122 RepID=A0A391NXU6_9EUKA|nr:hypothetical protein KIPB_008988 [Kipferlia bialata]|eukprot:g8988.t1